MVNTLLKSKNEGIISSTGMISTATYSDHENKVQHNLRSNYDFSYKKCQRLLNVSSSFICSLYYFVLPRIKCNYIRKLNVRGKVAVSYISFSLPRDSCRVPIWSPCTLIFQCVHQKECSTGGRWVTGLYLSTTAWMSKKDFWCFHSKGKGNNFIFFSVASVAWFNIQGTCRAHTALTALCRAEPTNAALLLIL